MTVYVIAVDVDGTLFDGLRVSDEDVEALRRATGEGHAVVVVTGRPWEDLPGIIAEVLPLAAGVVCEGGAVLADPAGVRRHPLFPPVDRRIAAGLAAAGVHPLALGEVMIGAPASALELTRRLCAEFGGAHIEINKASLAVLPSGCDKGTGLRHAIDRFGLHGRRVLAIGDASNDLPMFACADIAVAVAGADQTVRDAGIPMTSSGPGGAVAEALRAL